MVQQRENTTHYPKAKRMNGMKCFLIYHYRDASIPYLESHNIKSIITSDMKIKIHFAGENSRTYAREKFKHVVGYLLTDGIKEPKVVLGVGTDMDLANDFKEYFKLK